MKRNGRFRWDVYAHLRKRILRETELALAVGMQFPGRMPRIPTVEAGKGEFQPAFAARFWEEVLDLEDVGAATACAGANHTLLPGTHRWR